MINCICKRSIFAIYLSISVLSIGRLTWLVYIIGAVIGGRGSTYTTFEEYDALDGELVCRYCYQTVEEVTKVTRIRVGFLGSSDSCSE